MPQNKFLTIVLSVLSFMLLFYTDLMAQEPSKAEIEALKVLGITANFEKVLIPVDKGEWSSLFPEETVGSEKKGPLVFEILDTKTQKSLGYAWGVTGLKAGNLIKQDFITKCGTPSGESPTTMEYGRVWLRFGDDSHLISVTIPKK